MKLVILESPYAGDIEANVEYARLCVRDSLSRGEAPIASHLLYTQPGILRDEEPSERAWGIAAGLAWRKVAECSVFYTDRGWSSGMLGALHQALNAGALFELRAIHGEPQIPATLCEDMEAVIRSAVSSDSEVAVHRLPDYEFQTPIYGSSDENSTTPRVSSEDRLP